MVNEKEIARRFADLLNRVGVGSECGDSIEARIEHLAGQRDRATAERDAARSAVASTERHVCKIDAARQVAQYALDAAQGDRDRAYRLIGKLMILAEKKAEPGIN